MNRVYRNNNDNNKMSLCVQCGGLSGNPSTKEAKAGRFLSVQEQPGLYREFYLGQLGHHNEILSQNKQNKQNHQKKSTTKHFFVQKCPHLFYKCIKNQQGQRWMWLSSTILPHTHISKQSRHVSKRTANSS